MKDEQETLSPSKQNPEVDMPGDANAGEGVAQGGKQDAEILDPGGGGIDA